MGDAVEVKEKNPWVTYGAPLHRIREFGATMKELDILDESALSSEQMRVLLAHLFLPFHEHATIPHPVNWDSFLKVIKELNGNTPSVFCPYHKTEVPWLDEQQMTKMFKPESKSCIMS